MSNQDFDSSAGRETTSDISDGLGGSSDFTETSSKTWFERIIESLKAILFGLIFVVGSGALMFWNEGRSAQTAAALSEGAGLVLTVAAEKIDPASEGKLIHVAGDTRAAQAIRDPEFGFETRGLKLTRKVEMYQWKEESKKETQKKLGGGEETITRYSYIKEWTDKAVDSSRFRNSNDHRNPSMPSVSSRAFAAPDAKLGAFTLGDRLVQMLPASEKFDVPNTALNQARTRLGARARIEQGVIYAGANPDQPNIGDVRVTYQLLPLTQASVIARQTQSTFAPYLASNGRELLMAENGVQSAAIMFKHGQDENRVLTWILRAVGVLFMFIGFRMMLTLLEVLADIVPFIGNIVGAGASLVALLFTMIFAPIIIAFAWLFYRPLVAGGVILGGLALVYGVRALMQKRVATRGGTLPGPMPQPAGAAPSFLSQAPLARRLPGGPQ